MKNLFFALVLGLGLAHQVYSQDVFPIGVEHVVVIGVDGMSSEGLRKAKTPIMDRLIRTGSIAWNARVVLPTVSSPNWASMIHGAGPEQHSITSNDWRLGNGFAPVVEGENGRFPSIFDVIRASRPQATIGAVYHWDGFGALYDHRSSNLNKTYSTPDSTACAFADFIQQRQPQFAFIQLDHVDGAGHQYGHMTEGYLASINHTDSLVGLILDGIEKSGVGDKTLVLIVADHGGIGYGHGGETVEELTVPVLLHGAAIKSGYEVQQQVYIYDVAATIAYALRLSPPYAWIGRPIMPAFAGKSEPGNLWLGRQFLDKPTILPERHLYQQAGGLYTKNLPTVEIRAKSGETVYYTTDGTEPNMHSEVYKKPFELQETAVVKAKVINSEAKESRSDVAYFRVSKKKAGLRVSYYEPNEGDSWTKLPNFTALRPKQQWDNHEFRIDEKKIKELQGGDGNSFALVFEGEVSLDSAGEYTFYTQSDDGSKLYINDKLVVNNDGDHGVIEREGKVKLAKGIHRIRLEYFNGSGGYWLEAMYAGDGVVKQIIPADKMGK